MVTIELANQYPIVIQSYFTTLRHQLELTINLLARTYITTYIT